MLKGSTIKIFIVASLILLFLNTVIRVLEVDGYTNTIICLYLGGFSILGLLATVSPYILETHLLKTFPYLAHHVGRAALFIFISTLCFGEEMGWVGILNGISMIISAGLTIVLNDFVPVSPPSFNAEVNNQEI